MRQQFVVALIGAPHGVHGFCKVRSLSGEIEHLQHLEEVTIRLDGREKQLRLQEVKGGGTSLLMKFEGVESPEDAKKLQGAELLAERKFAAPLGKDEFYIEDLKGLAVVYNGTERGSVLDVIEGGGDQLLELNTPAGTRLVPFRKEFVGKIDLQAASIELLNDWILE